MMLFFSNDSIPVEMDDEGLYQGPPCIGRLLIEPTVICRQPQTTLPPLSSEDVSCTIGPRSRGLGGSTQAHPEASALVPIQVRQQLPFYSGTSNLTSSQCFVEFCAKENRPIFPSESAEITVRPRVKQPERCVLDQIMDDVTSSSRCPINQPVVSVDAVCVSNLIEVIDTASAFALDTDEEPTCDVAMSRSSGTVVSRSEEVSCNTNCRMARNNNVDTEDTSFTGNFRQPNHRVRWETQQIKIYFHNADYADMTYSQQTEVLSCSIKSTDPTRSMCVTIEKINRVVP